MEGRRLGKYTLIRKLGSGGMAELWLARVGDVATLAHLVAVKVMLPEVAEDPSLRAMFIDEARTGAQISHPNVVQIFELGCERDEYYLAMELILGENSGFLMTVASRSIGRLPIPISARIVAEACKGLHHAHTRRDAAGEPLRIVHRDVSPQNVMIAYDGEVKVIDFGIAKGEHRLQQTQAGMIRGKHRYMSPEQVRGEPVDHRSDIFSLGALMFQLCTGRQLFNQENAGSILLAVSRAEVPRPTSVDPSIPSAIEEIILRALRARPEDRFSDANAMRLALEEFLQRSVGLCTTDHVGRFVSGLCKNRLLQKLEICKAAYAFGTPNEAPRVTSALELEWEPPTIEVPSAVLEAFLRGSHSLEEQITLTETISSDLDATRADEDDVDATHKDEYTPEQLRQMVRRISSSPPPPPRIVSEQPLPPTQPPAVDLPANVSRRTLLLAAGIMGVAAIGLLLLALALR